MELHKMILFNKHKRVDVVKRFIFTLIIKLKTYQIKVKKYFRLKTKSSKLFFSSTKEKQVKQQNNIK